MLAIFKREFKSYFHNMIGYVFMAFFLAFAGFFVLSVNLSGSNSQFEAILPELEFVLLVLLPLLAMRSLSEDKQTGTDRLLYSLPLPTWRIVLGKYLATVAVLALPIAILFAYPFLLSLFGIVNYASAYGALLGFFFLCAALLAICTFMSSLTDSPIIAAVTSFALLLVLYLASAAASLIPADAFASFMAFLLLAALVTLLVYHLSKDLTLSLIVFLALSAILTVWYLLDTAAFASLFPNLVRRLAPFERFNYFVGGIFDIGAIVYYLSLILFFNTLTVLSVEKKRRD